nr:hypothetical protein [Corynebacterium lactis]
MSESAPRAHRARRPRRARFSGRTTPGGERLKDSAAEEPRASRSRRTKRGTGESDGTTQRPDALFRGKDRVGEASDASDASPAGVAAPAKDTDLRVDELELSSSSNRLTRLMGRRLYDKLGPWATYAHRSASFLTTSPGRLTAVAAILIVAILAAGLSMWQTTSDRQQQLTRISELSEPMAHASQNLYASLTIADASANTAFSRGTPDSNLSLGTNFDDAIAQAAMSATRAATGINNVNDPAMRDVTTVQRLLPVYTGMIETARTNARQGRPVGVAYLASASGLMRNEILPAAQSLYEKTSTNTSDEQRALSIPPLIPMSGILAALIMLLSAQWWMTRKNGRLFNVGLFGATLLMAGALLGVAIATTQPLQGSALFGAKQPQVQALTEARIGAQQLRATETLGLVRRQPADAENFSQSLDKLTKQLEDVSKVAPSRDVDAALTSIKAWERGHQEMVSHLDSGDYAGAVTVATGADSPASSAVAFRDLDESLRSSITDARLLLRQELDNSRRASAIISLFTVTITAIAALMVALGFRNRLLEYL